MDICHYVLYGLNVAPTAILETLLTSLSSWLTYSSPVVGLSVKSAEYDWFTKPNVSGVTVRIRCMQRFDQNRWNKNRHNKHG